MKKFTVLLLLIAIAISVSAQQSSSKVSGNEPQWKSYISFGSAILTRQGFRDFGDTFIKEEFKNLYPNDEIWVGSVNSTQNIPVLELRYKYLINPNIALGIRGSYVRYKHDGTLAFNGGHNFSADWNISYITGMADLNFIYVDKEFIKLYAGISAGVSQYNLKFDKVSNPEYDDLLNKSEQRLYFAYEVIAFGITFGKQIGGFVEMGYGYAGMVNFGIYAGF